MEILKNIWWYIVRVFYHIFFPSLMIIDDSVPIPDKYRGLECLYRGIKTVYLGSNTYIRV